jgi:hypothetical protein
MKLLFIYLALVLAIAFYIWVNIFKEGNQDTDRDKINNLIKTKMQSTDKLQSDKVSPGITRIDRYSDPMCKPNEYIYCIDGQIECQNIFGDKMDGLQGTQSDKYTPIGNTLLGCASHINKTNLIDYSTEIGKESKGIYFDLSNCTRATPWRLGGTVTKSGNKNVVSNFTCHQSELAADNSWNYLINTALNANVTYKINDEVLILDSFLKTQTKAGLSQLLIVLDNNKDVNPPYTTINGQKYYYATISAITGNTYTVYLSTIKLTKLPLTKIEILNVKKSVLLPNSLYNPKTNDYYNTLNSKSYPRPVCKSGTFTSCLSSHPFEIKKGIYVSTKDPLLSIDSCYNEFRHDSTFDYSTPFSTAPVNPSGILDTGNLLEYNYFTTKNNETPFIKCIANHGSDIGDPLCCNQNGIINDTKFICPQEVPTCMGYSKDENIYGYCS